MFKNSNTLEFFRNPVLIQKIITIRVLENGIWISYRSVQNSSVSHARNWNSGQVRTNLKFCFYVEYNPDANGRISDSEKNMV